MSASDVHVLGKIEQRSSSSPNRMPVSLGQRGLAVTQARQWDLAVTTLAIW